MGTVRRTSFSYTQFDCELLPCIKCLLYTNICTNKWTKFILDYSDMFRCSYTIFREFTVVLVKVMNY